VKLLSNLKNLLVSPQRKAVRILAGSFHGIRMALMLQSQFQVYVGLFERETYPWLNRLSAGIATAIDVGAAHGEYTIFFLQRTRATQVFAFEPDSTCLPFLHENLALNGLQNDGRLRLSTNLVGASNSTQQITLDSLAASIRSPCFVKLDVDGAEEEVLRGAANFNRLPGIRWLIETHTPKLELACDQMLKATGFQTKIISNAWWRAVIPELRPIAHNRWLVAWKPEDLSL
jgi:hypothetical protein